MANRITIVAGSIIVGGSIVLAIVIHRPVVYCSYLRGAPPPGCITSDYSMAARAGIVIAGLILALLIMMGDRLWARWKHK